jgi:hypothetical protein
MQSSRRIQSNDSFSPEALDMMSEAFEIAWNFVERSTAPAMSERSALREVLARNIVLSARLGETNKVALANFAIVRLRADSQPRRSRL